MKYLVMLTSQTSYDDVELDYVYTNCIKSCDTEKEAEEYIENYTLRYNDSEIFFVKGKMR